MFTYYVTRLFFEASASLCELPTTDLSMSLGTTSDAEKDLVLVGQPRAPHLIGGTPA